MRLFGITFILCLSFSVHGTQLYRRCIACHGARAEGREAMKAPRLAGQHAWYLEQQLKLFRSEERKGGNAKRMYPYAKQLTDEDIKELSKYLEGLSNAKK